MPRSTSACFNAVRTPKSPQPGHQSGSTLPLKSLTVIGARPTWSPLLFDILTSRSTVSTLIVHSLDHDFMDRDIFLRCAGQNRFDTVHDMMRHEGLAVVFPNMAVSSDAGFEPQITRELAAIIIFDHN